MPRHLPRLPGTLTLAALLTIGCGGGDGGTGPGTSTFASVAVSPAAATLSVSAPGNSVLLTAQARNGDGQPVAGAGAASFQTNNAAVATVAANGLVTAVSAGTARITASITVGGVTKTGEANIAVQGSQAPVFTSVALTPNSATLFTVAPEMSMTFVATALDGNGQAMAAPGPVTFGSSNAAVATVDLAGLVTAVTPGSSQIMASFTIGGVTRTGTATVTVVVANLAATVQMPQFSFTPPLVDVRSGGTVTWTGGEVDHTVDFTLSGSPANLVVAATTSGGRTFPTSGFFPYFCSIHAGMTGIVRVH